MTTTDLERISAEVPAPLLSDDGLSLDLPQDLTYEQYEALGVKLDLLHRCSPWYVGDWLVHGEQYLSERWEGALDVVKLDPQTLRDYARVADKVPPDRRRRELSWLHHKVVAPLKAAQQKSWLKQAVDNNWKVNELADRVRNREPGGPSRSAQIQDLCQRLWSSSERLDEETYAVKAFIFLELLELTGATVELPAAAESNGAEKE